MSDGDLDALERGPDGGQKRRGQRGLARRGQSRSAGASAHQAETAADHQGLPNRARPTACPREAMISVEPPIGFHYTVRGFFFDQPARRWPRGAAIGYQCGRIDPRGSRPPRDWPRDARAACAFTFDLDAATCGWARRARTVTLSQGPLRSAWRRCAALALLRANEIRASSSSTEWVASITRTRCANRVRRPRDRLAPATSTRRSAICGFEREEAIHGQEPRGVTRIGGKRPARYRAPRMAAIAETLGLLGRHGRRYSSNMMTGCRVPAPGERRGARRGDPGLVGARRRAVLMFTGQRSIQPPARAQGLAHRVRGAHRGARDDQLTLHPQIIGRAVAARLPARADRPKVRHTPRVGSPRLEEISAHYRATAAPGGMSWSRSGAARDSRS